WLLKGGREPVGVGQERGEQRTDQIAGIGRRGGPADSLAHVGHEGLDPGRVQAILVGVERGKIGVEIAHARESDYSGSSWGGSSSNWCWRPPWWRSRHWSRAAG